MMIITESVERTMEEQLLNKSMLLIGLAALLIGLVALLSQNSLWLVAIKEAFASQLET